MPGTANPLSVGSIPTLASIYLRLYTTPFPTLASIYLRLYTTACSDFGLHLPSITYNILFRPWPPSTFDCIQQLVPTLASIYLRLYTTACSDFGLHLSSITYNIFSGSSLHLSSITYKILFRLWPPFTFDYIQNLVPQPYLV